MPPVDDVARALVQAEERLRADGITGARAFRLLLEALRFRLGDDRRPDPVALEATAGVPLDGEVDLLGLAWERFFPDLFKGLRGQFFTPRPLVELLLGRAGVRPGLEVVDPTCGSGGFLVCAARLGARVRGLELDPDLAELARLNLRLAGLEGEVRQGDFFAAPPEPADLVVANPPFSVEVRDPAILARYDLGRGRERALSDWLFVEALERWVRPGGGAAIVLPWSVLVNRTWEPLRARLEAAWERQALCALPEGVFRPFGGAAGRAALLWLRRRPQLPFPTRWASLRDPGYDVRSRHHRSTGSDEVQRLIRGEGWADLPPGAWVPEAPRVGGRPARELLRPAGEAVLPAREPGRRWVVVDLADADKATGEITRATVAEGREIRGGKVGFSEGDLLVSRLRPGLGNVAVARRPVEDPGPLVGSTEWLPLRPLQAPYAVLLALRTPTWRAQLAVTGGQTRPRTSLEAVLDTAVPWPGDAVAAQVDELAARLHHERSALRERLDALQGAMDRYAAGELDEEGLAAEVARLRGDPP